MSESLSDLALREFKLWLPGELRYSATKAGYDKKVERAHLPLEDPASVYGFLGAEWQHFRLLHDQGRDYLPFHAKTAQLQLAKVAAGLFDKVGVGLWLGRENRSNEDDFAALADHASFDVLSREPWLEPSVTSVAIDTPFEDTPFASGVTALTQDIVSLTADPSDMFARIRLYRTAMELGGQATVTYVNFASQFLTAEQQVLPPSELAT